MNRADVIMSIEKMMVQAHIALYRFSRGRLLGKHSILITTTGRKSGITRTRAIYAVRDGANYVLLASHGGAPTHPAWYLNLQANPRVTVEDHGKILVTKAAIVSDEAEYKRLWSKMTAMYPAYDDYQQRTQRKIPVVLLTPVD